MVSVVIGAAPLGLLFVMLGYYVIINKIIIINTINIIKLETFCS